MQRRSAVAVVVALVVLVGLGLLADVVLRDRAEASVAAEVATELGAPQTGVTIGGFPFVTQVLAGTLDRVDLTAPSVTLDGVRLTDVTARLRGVSTGTPRTVADLQLTGSLDPTSLGAVLPQGVTLAASGGRLVASLDVGVPIEATVVPTAAGRAVGITVGDVMVAGFRVAAADLPFGAAEALAALSIPLDGLPVGIELTSVSVVGSRIQVAAAGTDVVLTAASGGSGAG